MQPKTHRLISVLLLLALLLTLAAPAMAQEPTTAAAAIEAAGATCSPLTKEQQATFDRLAQLKETGQLDSAGYDLFVKLLEQAECAAAAAAPEGGEAVSGYTFAQTSGAYTEITGGTLHGSGTTVDDNNYNAVNIGFTFTYDGANYTQVGINANGFVRMGGTAFTTSCLYTPISSTDTTNCKNLVSALGMDLQGNALGELRSQTTGTTPNQVFTVQWKDFRYYNVTSEGFNFQIKLYETSNKVELVYGAFTKNTTSRSPQVGIKGATNADYSNRTGSNWAASTAGGSNAATMTLSTTALPASGQTYTWTPPSGPPACAVSPSPANAATGVSISTTLAWSAGSGTTPTSHDVYFGTAASPPFVANVTASPYSPGTLAYSTTYYWQIVPKNASGPATGCPVWSFTTMADPTVTVFPYSQDFNGASFPGWTVENTNGDANVWGIGMTYRRGILGGAAIIFYNSTLAMNDWLFTPPLQLTGGVTYGVRFFYRSSGATFPEKMEVKWGSTASSAGMTNGPIFDNSNIINTEMKQAIATFTPGSSGIYYVGFHGYSAADMYYLVVDDVTVYDTADSTWQWQGGAGNDWFVNANWEGSIVPGELDEVKIPVVVRAPSASSPFIGPSTETSYGRVNNLTVDAGATLELGTNHNLKVQGTLTNNGTLKQTRAVSLGSPTVFLNITDGATTPVSKYFGVEMNPTSVNMGNTTVTVSGNQQCAGVANTTVKRCFTVTPTTQAAADIKFYFSEPEMTPTGQPLASQNVWNYHTSAWNAVTRGTDSGACASGAINCFVQGTGIANYSPFVVGPAQPLAVTLASFTAQGGADRITVAWETVSETGNAGFNLYRADSAAGPQTLLTYVPSQAPGSSQGFAYGYEDLAVQPGQTWWYTLEDVALNGATTLHGPISATVQAPTAVTLASVSASPAAGTGAALPWLLGAAGAGLALAASRLRRRA